MALEESDLRGNKCYKHPPQSHQLFIITSQVCLQLQESLDYMVFKSFVSVPKLVLRRYSFIKPGITK